MSILVDDTSPQWIFSSYNGNATSMSDAGWHQLADDPSADTAGYYNGTAMWTTTPGASATLVFQGTGIYLYSAWSPLGGNMSIALDAFNTTVSLKSTASQPGETAYELLGLDPGVVHALTVQMVGGGKINIDNVGITPGPPSAFPPTMPQPVPPAFPGGALAGISPTSVLPISQSKPTIIQVTGQTITVTATVPSATSPASPGSSSLVKGVRVGLIAVGVVALTLLAAVCFLVRRRLGRRRSRSLSKRSSLPQSRLRRLYLTLGGNRSSMNSTGSGPGFVQIKDEEMMDKPKRGSGGSWVGLPSIKHASTLNIFEDFAPSPTPSSPETILSKFPIPPVSRNVSLAQTHNRNHSLAISLSINTDLGGTHVSRAVSNSATTKASRVGSLGRQDSRLPMRAHRRVFSGFSSVDRTETVQEDNQEVEQEGERNRESLEYYAAFARSDHHYTSEGDEGEGVDDDNADDYDGEDGPGSPLIPNSPAVESSNASQSHGGSSYAHSSRLSTKGNKILRSLRTRSSKRSSLHYSLGRKSSRASGSIMGTPRTPDSKTPISTATSGAAESPQYDLYGRPLSYPERVPTIPAQYQLPNAPPPAFARNSEEYSTQANAVPSAWDNSPSLRSAPSHPRRPHRPIFGPRARSTPNTSTSSAEYSSSEGAVLVLPMSNDPEALSVVEEVSPGAQTTGRPSLDDFERSSVES
ncbi:hypothetical protein M0805_005809 [Coniferiporia weirii]|nr:hypothetical protein M0805_005809 [Coniferiporia weirii]